MQEEWFKDILTIEIRDHIREDCVLAGQFRCMHASKLNIFAQLLRVSDLFFIKCIVELLTERFPTINEDIYFIKYFPSFILINFFN